MGESDSLTRSPQTLQLVTADHGMLGKILCLMETSMELTIGLNHFRQSMIVCNLNTQKGDISRTNSSRSQTYLDAESP